MKKLLILSLCSILLVSAGLFSGCSKSSSNSRNKVSAYSVTISPVPVVIQYGAYGVLKAEVVNNLTGEAVENPEIVWTVTNDFGTFDSPTSSSTVFRAKASGSGAASQKITAVYNTADNSFKKELAFIGGNASGSGLVWYEGNNDGNTVGNNGYTITITSPAANGCFILKNTNAQLKAVVKDGNGLVVNDAVVNWSVPSGIGSFSSTSAETVFTAGTANYNGQITAECNGAVAVRSIIIGEIDSISFNVNTLSNTLIKNGPELHITAVVSANGYVLNPQPQVNWQSSNPSAVTVTPNISGGIDARAISFPGGISRVTITANVPGTLASGTVNINVKDVITVYNDSVSVDSLSVSDTNLVGSLYQVTGGGGVSGDSNNYFRIIYNANAGGCYVMWPLSRISTSGYTKIKISVKGQNGGERVRVHYANFVSVTKDVTLTTSWQEIEVDVRGYNINGAMLAWLDYAFSIELLDNRASTTTVYFDNAYLN